MEDRNVEAVKTKTTKPSADNKDAPKTAPYWFEDGKVLFSQLKPFNFIKSTKIQ